MPMSNGYELNEKDIDSVLEILKRTDPENATPERAIAILEDLSAEFHLAAHTDLEALIKLDKKLKLQKKMKTN